MLICHLRLLTALIVKVTIVVVSSSIRDIRSPHRLVLHLIALLNSDSVAGGSITLQLNLVHGDLQ